MIVFEVPGSHEISGIETGTAYPFKALVESVCDWVGIAYPGKTFPMGPSVAAGVAALTTAITTTTGPFALIGTSQGAIVTSNVYDQLRTGTLQAHRPRLRAAVTVGNPRRQAGHTFPGCPDPGGHGIAASRLTGTEELWWDLAAPGDILTCCPDGPVGQLETAAYLFVMSDYKSLWSLLPLLFRSGGVQLMAAVMGLVNGIASHLVSYHQGQPLGDGRSYVQIGADYINTIEED